MAIHARSLLVAFAACRAPAPISSPPRAESAALARGMPAPQVEIVDLDARAVALHGQRIVLDFWESTCEPCIRDLPILADLDARHVVMLVSITPEPADDVRAFVASHGITWRVAADHAGTVHAAFRVDRYPLYFVVDADGRLACVRCSLAEVARELEIPHAGIVTIL